MLLNQVLTAPHPHLRLPEPLLGLSYLATNLYWSWNEPVAQLFREIAPEKFDRGIGPVQILIEERDWAKWIMNEDFVNRVHHEAKRMQAYLNPTHGTFATHRGMDQGKPIAYFCAEYGLHESFAQYSGGLGILAGDHCKEASDMGLPFVAIGCFYRLGFFRQVLDASGRQEHLYPEFDPALHPIERVLHPETREPLTVSVEFPGRSVAVAVWRVAVGRVPLLLLDTHLPENAPEDRAITSQLYMRGREMRFCQELVLGVAGVRALRALGLDPAVFHMNEGHSSMLLVELLKNATESGLSFAKAQDQVQSVSVLTIHTPVPAGNERFDAHTVEAFMGSLLAQTKLPVKSLVKLGRGDDNNPRIFDMTAFALRLSRAANGVSLLHGEVADQTWRPVVGRDVSGITNGVHMPTWLGPSMQAAYEQAGAHFSPATTLERDKPEGRHARWNGASKLSDQAIWDAHQQQKHALVSFATQRLFKQLQRAGEGPTALREVLSALNPDAFLIGFARRFATYKRAALIFRDPKRLEKLLSDPNKPVQVIFSGKAHPADTEGQALIAQIYRFTRDRRFAGKVFLLEDYDMATGRMLVQGVDLWINNPRRPLEASGTSGMKAAANGVPNASILDGWWDEAHSSDTPPNGFAVGDRKPRKNLVQQDKFDAHEMMRVLEEEVLPLYWKRGSNKLPKEWIAVMRSSIASSIWDYSTQRMLVDYLDQLYGL